MNTYAYQTGRYIREQVTGNYQAAQQVKVWKYSLIEEYEDNNSFLYGKRRLYMIDLIDCLDSNL
jgi:hypothetical protein